MNKLIVWSLYDAACLSDDSVLKKIHFTNPPGEKNTARKKTTGEVRHFPHLEFLAVVDLGENRKV